jgi:non-ribosomal peptide synthetase component E (peptide arylation enzyme)
MVKKMHRERALRKTHRELIKGWHPFTEEECERYAAKGLWHNLTVLDLLDRNAEVFPHKLAIVDEKTEVTWRELQERAIRLAIHLNRLGVGYGDFFVLDLVNTVEYTYFYFGLNRIGAIPVMCLPRHRRAEVEHQIKLHDAKGIVVPVGEKFDYVGMVDEIRAQHPGLEIFLTVGGEAPPGWKSTEELIEDEVEKEHAPDFLERLRPDSNDICIEQLSGGTTGLPKGIPKTHNEYICQWDYLGRAAGHTDESIALIVIPALHNAAFALCLGPSVFRGGTVVLCKTASAEKQFEMIQRYRVTHIMLIPIQITYWMRAEREMKAYDLSSLKVIWSGAEKVRPEFVKWVLDDLGVNFVNIFGTTEGIHFCTRWTTPKEPQMRTIGRPLIVDPDVEVRLVDGEGRDVNQGEIGEMISRGALTFKGYFRNNDENKNSFDEQGFFYSGDLMSFREDGYYVVEGRKKDMITRAGENIYPAAVEDRIAAFHKVAHCAVVGMPDQVLGEKLCAFVEPAKGETISLDDLIGFLKGLGIAVFSLPERLEIVDGWPLTPKNAIDKRRLRAYITAKAVEEGAISKEFGNDYLKRDKSSVNDVLEGKAKIDFTQTPN